MDSLDPLGESQIGLGSISSDGFGIGIRLTLGELVDADYSLESDKLVILYTRGDSDHRLRGLIYDSPPDSSASNIFDRLRIALGVDYSTWRTISLAGGLSVYCPTYFCLASSSSVVVHHPVKLVF